VTHAKFLPKSLGIAMAIALALAGQGLAWHDAQPGRNGKIAFVRGGDTFEIRIVNADGSDEHRLTSQASGVTLRWSPDGQALAFSCLPSLGVDPIFFDICTVSEDGAVNAKLTNDSNSAGPIWSRDGSKIFFYRDSGMWSMGPDGTDKVSYPASGLPSPDGRKVLFTRRGAWLPREEAYENDVFVSDLDGRNVVPLSAGPESDFGEDWSPDGKQILFTRYIRDSRTTQLWLVNPDGTAPRLLLDDGRSHQWIQWSPDGSMISFDVFQSDSYDSTMYVMRSDGTGLRELATGHRPGWSPDGKKLAFSRFVNFDYETRDVFTINVDGTDERHLAGAPEPDDSHPSWQPIPNRAPECDSAAANVTSIAAKRKSIRPIQLRGTDPDGDDVTLTITAVTQDEPVSGWRDRTAPDAFHGPTRHEVGLRAENSNRGDGRVYSISFDASDGRGGECSGAVTVTVPRKGRAVDSAPPSFDSFGR
jgi:TolB protein